MECLDPLLHPVHHMVIELYVFSPLCKGISLRVAAKAIDHPESSDFILGLLILEQALLLVLKVLTLWDSLLQGGPCVFKSHLSIVKFDGIEALFEESLVSDAADFLNKDLFLAEELLLASLLTPVLPGKELVKGTLIPGLLTCEL